MVGSPAACTLQLAVPGCDYRELGHQWSVTDLDSDAVMANLRTCPVPCVVLGVDLSCLSLHSPLHR